MSDNEPLTRGVEATVTVSWLPEPFAGWVAVCVTLWRSPGKEDDAGLDYGFLQWAIGVIAAVLPGGRHLRMGAREQVGLRGFDKPLLLHGRPELVRR